MKNLLIGLLCLLVTGGFCLATEVSLSEGGGVYHTTVKLNNMVELLCLVDSGASSTIIPKDVVIKLRERGTIGSADIQDTQRFSMANGDFITIPIINIKTMTIGATDIYNVVVGVGTRDQYCLLGQSFLKRLDYWSINNVNRTLTLGNLR